MTGGEKVRDLFGSCCEVIDTGLEKVFKKQADFAMYSQMAYFMGFADESLKPARIYGGKRFRSSLTLLLGDWYAKKDVALDAALSIELFHNFTLIHDDIVDGDTLRRGRPTVWKLFGEDHAINTGDSQLLLALESVMESKMYRPAEKVAVQNFLIRQYKKVIEGQFLDFEMTKLQLGDVAVTEEAYFEMVGKKTADLIAAATNVAGVVTGQGEEECQKLFDYGYNLGLAYQLCDDLVSIWGTGAQTGKREYGDILERKKTLPIIRLHSTGSDSVKKELTDLYNGTEKLTDTDAERVVALLDESDMYDFVSTKCREYAKMAKESAETLSLSDEHKKTLEEVVDMLLPDIKRLD